MLVMLQGRGIWATWREKKKHLEKQALKKKDLEISHNADRFTHFSITQYWVMQNTEGKRKKHLASPKDKIKTTYKYNNNYPK